MIGSVPKGAPLRCKLGLHKVLPPPRGGLLFYQCPRCKGTFPQTKDYGRQLSEADAAIDRGDLDEAERILEEANK